MRPSAGFWTIIRIMLDEFPESTHRHLEPVQDEVAYRHGTVGPVLIVVRRLFDGQ
jgi:hypothetical protein